MTAHEYSHFVDGKSWAGAGGRRGDVFDPATGEVAAEVDAGLGGRRRRRRVLRARPPRARGATCRWPGVPPCCSPSGRSSTRAAPSWPPRSPPSTARCSSDAAGEVQRGLEVVEYACGIPALVRGGFSENVSTGGRLVQPPPAARGGRGDLAVQLPGHGADVVRADRGRLRQRGRAQADRRRTRPPSTLMAEWFAEAGLPRRRAQRGARRQGGGRRAAGPSGGAGASRSSAPPRSPATSTARHRPTASGCRRSAGRRTTWWCCPTPTSTWPPTRRSTAGFGSAGERCMAISVVVAVEPVADDAGRQDRGADGRHPHRRRPARGCDMGPLVTRAHRDRVASYVDAGVGGRRDAGRGRARRRAGRRRRRVLARPDAVRPGHAGDVDLHGRDLRAGALGGPGRVVRRGAGRWSTPTRTATAPRSSPTTAARPGASSTRWRSAWSASTCRSRYRWRTTRSAAGSRRFSATPTPTAPTACTSYTRGKVVTEPLAGPLPRRGRPGLPHADLDFRVFPARVPGPAARPALFAVCRRALPAGNSLKTSPTVLTKRGLQ